MKKQLRIVVAIVLVIALQSRVLAQQAAYQSQGFSPGFDDMMTILVQPRHIRLHFAGVARNWELAAAESRNLRQSLERVAATIPAYQGIGVGPAVAGFLKPGMDAIDAAIANADFVAFDAAYQQVTAGCNACHTYMEHPYLVIKVPSGAVDLAHSDQDYTPMP